MSCANATAAKTRNATVLYIQNSFSLDFLYREVIEIRYTVSFRPKTCFAGFGKRPILGLEQPFSVEVNNKQAISENDPKRIPAVLRYLVLDTVSPRWHALRCNGQTNAVFHLVEHRIVYQGVRTNDVVVVLVLVSPHDSSSLINDAGHSLERDADLPIPKRSAFPYHDGKPASRPILRSLSKHVWRTWSRLITDDLPLSSAAFVGHGDGPPGRQLARRASVEPNHLCRGDQSQKYETYDRSAQRPHRIFDFATRF